MEWPSRAITSRSDPPAAELVGCRRCGAGCGRGGLLGAETLFSREKRVDQADGVVAENNEERSQVASEVQGKLGCHARLRQADGPFLLHLGSATGTEASVHPGYPHVVQPDHAPGVDTGEHFDAVTGPLGDIGCGNAGVQPLGDACMPQVVRPFHERCHELFRGESQATDFPPDLPPGRGLDHPAALAAEETAVGSRPEALDVLP